ncbi:MAG: HD domain-containing phosphohydrolase, partial [Acidobacteriota bacterium]
MLNGLPFPKKLERVPEYAGGHHEKLDGTGYPLGLRADQLSLHTRIIAIADIFEALTARDRPYKSAMTPEKAIQILEGMKDNHLDSDLYDLLIHTGLFKEYVKHELD